MNGTMKQMLLLLTALLMLGEISAQRSYRLLSPNEELEATISIGEELTYSIRKGDEVVLAASPLALHLTDGTTLGKRARVERATRQSVDEIVESNLYHASRVRDHYNALTLRMKGNWSVEFRAYDDGVAYRFISHRKEPFEIQNEQVEYRFAADHQVVLPYVNRGKDGDFHSQLRNSFENTYTVDTLSQLNPHRLSFLPLVVKTSARTRCLITESNLEAYPGLYLVRDTTRSATLKGYFAPCPQQTRVGGYLKIQQIVTGREEFIARIPAPRALPWRIAIIGEDTTLAASDLTWLLADPSRIEDPSWIRPGKAAWDWWNAWNLSGVDFRAGINTDTYKYYIDFAAQSGVEYILIDDGWTLRGENQEYDLLQVIPQLDLPELVRYASERGVGILLWAGYWPFDRAMEEVCRHYSEMGIKGFKVDFMDRDDQDMTAFNYRAAEMAAKYHLLLDLHGTHKAAGLNRTWPNVLNVEGVYGQENTKWNNYDQPLYEVMIPFIRQAAGPMDYTQGAMLNATKRNYYPCHTEPMSQGTRSRQLALYVVLESPLNMLCDSPTNYLREAESMAFISAVPTVWDETRVLSGEMGEYVVMARRKGDCWFVGGLTNWSARDLEIDLNSLVEVGAKVTLYRDGTNADRKATDYKCEQLTVGDQPLSIHLAPGGGFAAIVQR